MKILFVNEYSYPNVVSGAEFSMEALAETLIKSGNEITIISPSCSYALVISKLIVNWSNPILSEALFKIPPITTHKTPIATRDKRIKIKVITTVDKPRLKNLKLKKSPFSFFIKQTRIQNLKR